MSLTDENPPPQRRRGAALEAALLDAAWDELLEKGYDAFTIESVAERAQTARAVIYRRWATKPDLVRAAVAFHGRRERVSLPDTGSLRGDLIELLRGMNRRRATRLGILMIARLGGFYADSGASLADLRHDLLAGRGQLVDQLFERAVERGDADPGKLTPRVRSVALDLFRHELLLTLRPVSEDVIAMIVDEIALPLVRPS